MYRVGIVGIGPIAALAWGEPGDVAPYNHAGGIYQSERVDLVAVADLAVERRQAFLHKWGSCFPNVRAYDSIAAMVAAQDLDIISICVRGPHHLAVALEVIQARPRAIFLEKPPTCSLHEMDELLAATRSAAIPITVSYSRHWAPVVLRMEQVVKAGLIGDVQTVIGYCGSSVLSFASHTTDLICQFAGYRPVAVYARGQAGSEAPEGYEPEPGLSSVIIEYESGVSGIQLGVASEYGSMLCEVIGTEGRARVGMYTPPSACDKKGRSIDLAQDALPVAASPFKGAYDEIAEYLDGGPLPACTNEEWIAVHEIGFGAIESILTGQRITLPSARRTRRIFANG